MSDKNDPAGPTVLQEPGRGPQGAVWMRGLNMLLVAVLICLAQSVLHALTLIQFILMLLDKGRPNAQIASFGKSLGAWLQKAARYQTAESEDRPWPFSPAD